MYKVMLCGNPRYAGEFPNSPIIEMKEFSSARIRCHPREYADGHIEVDEYQVTHVGTPGQPDEFYASADFVRTETI